MSKGDCAIEQAVRVSSCSHLHPDQHACVGSCKITPKGIELECSLCGDNENGIHLTEEWIKIQLILRVIGIDINLVDYHSVEKMIQEL